MINYDLTPREILAKAAEYLSAHGKADRFQAADGAVCAFGAIAAVTGQLTKLTFPEDDDDTTYLHHLEYSTEPDEDDPAMLAGFLLARTLSAPADLQISWLSQHPLERVFTWSDANSTEDVILHLKKAAHDVD